MGFFQSELTLPLGAIFLIFLARWYALSVDAYQWGSVVQFPMVFGDFFWILLERVISKVSKLYYGLLCKQIDIDNQFFCVDCENIRVRTWVPNKHGVKLKS